MNSHEIKAAILNPFRPGNGLQKNYPDKQSLVGAVVVARKSGEKLTGGSGKWRFLISSRLLGAIGSLSTTIENFTRPRENYWKAAEETGNENSTKIRGQFNAIRTLRRLSFVSATLCGDNWMVIWIFFPGKPKNLCCFGCKNLRLA
jgi:hypothetical protein